MSDFAHYLDPRIPLEQHLVSAFEELRIASEQREALIGFLAPLKVKSKQTYEHSLRRRGFSPPPLPLPPPA